METKKAAFNLEIHRFFVVFNIFLSVCFVVAASTGWRIPEENGQIPVTGEPFAWFGAILPVLVIALIANGIWAVLILRKKSQRSGRYWLYSVFVWIIAILYDNAHH